MNTRQMRYFIAVAQRQHMGEAAAELNLSESALSRSIAALEQEYGTRLFDRVGRGIRLNSFGRILLEHINRAFAELENGDREIRAASAAGALSVTMGFIASLGTFDVPEIVRTFRSEHPDVRLHLSEGEPRVLRESIVTGEIDLAIGTLPYPDPAIDWRPLWREGILAYMPASHPLAARETLALEHLAGEDVLLFRAAKTSRDALIAMARDAEAPVRIALESSSIGTLFALTRAGFGISLVPESLRDVPAGLRAVPIEATPYRTIGLATLRSRESTAAQALLERCIVTLSESGRIGPPPERRTPIDAELAGNGSQIRA